MKNKITRILSIALPLLLGVFLIIYAYNQFSEKELSEIQRSFKTADYLYVGVALFVGFTGYVARAYRWKYTLEHMGYTAPFAVKFSAVCITYLMNITIPRSGEVSRALVLKRYADVPFDKGFGTIISERVIDLFLLIFCLGLTISLQFSALKDYLSENVPYEKLLFYGVIALILFTASVLFYMYSRMAWLQKLKIKISGLVEGVLSVFKMRNKWPFLILSVYIWVTYVVMFYITVFALPETAGLSFNVVMLAFVVGSIAITFSNGGFGVFPFAVAKLLENYGITYAAGTAFGWIMWASQTGLVIILGGLSFLMLPLLFRKK
ncbi:flippase-like domain-containing protein [Flavobacterium sp. Sd200]|uniref:lysylphosphatidylglycerol synthase transmembrane domain-containing protein n=1 Tax=Flavobacterium sp. Sd200 TaxID=2692211 RepID=UPI00136C90C1|nr:lysylphosphatidylglycerol synthase transmembrane domain-containing protein [Flavobacterium sp. Sd200]MXN92769.1 flippase-like domain-containing protein [Flavobacterium sp. Sd200]